MKKVSLIGFGNIGFQIAIALKNREIEIPVFDIKKEVSEGRILDLNHCPDVRANIYLTDDYEFLSNSDFVIITAGVPRKENQTREDILNINKPIIYDVSKKVKQFCPDAFVIMVTNPLDVMLHEFILASDFSKQRCIGMSSGLDTQRFRGVLAQYFDTPVDFVDTIVIGEHNDRMFFLKEHTKINGVGISEYLAQGKISEKKLEELFEKSKSMGATINKLTGSSAYVAPALHCVDLLDKIISKHSTILASCYIENKNISFCEGRVLKVQESNEKCIVLPVDID